MTAILLAALLALAPAQAAPPTGAGGPEDPAWQAAFGPYIQAVAAGNDGAAADALVVITQDLAQAPYHGEAWRRLGALAEDKGYPHAALLAYTQGIGKGGDDAALVAKALELGPRVGDMTTLQEMFAGNVGAPVPKEQKGYMVWLAAQGNYLRGNLSTTLAVVSLIPKDDAHYARGQLLKGIVLSQQERFTDAVVPLAVAAQLTEGTDLQELVNLNLARAYYGAGNYARAIEHFAKVPRASAQWPEAQFERAWAHFRLDDVNGALGVLQTLRTPFFDTWYMPEAWMLRAYSLFLLCKFPEATRQIEDFNGTYVPLQQALAAGLAGANPQGTFQDLAGWLEGGQSAFPEAVLTPWKSDERLAAAVSAVKSARTEAENLQRNNAGPGWDHLGRMLQDRVKELSVREGERVLVRFRAQLSDLQLWLQDAKVAQLDMLRLETRLFEAASVTGALEESRRLAARKPKLRDNQRYWPYDGEIWADELGYYRASVFAECPPGLVSGGQ